MILSRPKHEVEERSRIIRDDFERRYDINQLREQLFFEQEGICAICKKPIQDSSSVICSVDHAISINMIANWDWDTEKAITVANARCNLLVVHVPCNSWKRECDYEEIMEQIERGEIIFGEIPELSVDSISALKSALTERARKAGRLGGLISGRKNAESGHLDIIRELPQSIEANIKNGRNNVIYLNSVLKGLGAHTRWHVDRNIENPDCKFCTCETT